LPSIADFGRFSLTFCILDISCIWIETEPYGESIS
jgi:hypothetical protein